jgi:hypothetical protein
MIHITINKIEYNLNDVVLWRYLISLLLKLISSQNNNTNVALETNTNKRERNEDEDDVDDDEREKSEEDVDNDWTHRWEWMSKVYWWRESLFIFPLHHFTTSITDGTRSH